MEEEEIDAAQGWIDDLLDKFDLLELKVGKKMQDSNRAKTVQTSQSTERSKSQERTYGFAEIRTHNFAYTQPITLVMQISPARRFYVGKQ